MVGNKFISLLCCLLALGLACSCNKSEEVLESSSETSGRYGEEKADSSGTGISFVCSISDLPDTKVSIQGTDTVSLLSWETGDTITIRYDNKNYLYRATKAGRENIPFEPVSTEAGEYLDSGLDGNKPIFYFYNMSDCADGSAKFTISATQTAGALTNKMPLYGYDSSSTTRLEKGTLYFTMTPAAQVLQLSVTYASKATDVRKVEFESFSTDGYLCGSGEFSINTTNGEVTAPTSGSATKMELSYGSDKDFSAATSAAESDIYLIVGPATVKDVRLTMYNSSGALRFWHSFYLETAVNFSQKHTHTELRNAITNGPDLFYACEHSWNDSDPSWSLFNEGASGNGAVNIRADIDAVTADHRELYETSRGMNSNIQWSVPTSDITEDNALLVNDGGTNKINWHLWQRQEGVSETVPCYQFNNGNLNGNNKKITIYSDHTWSHAALLRNANNSTITHLRVGGQMKVKYAGSARNVYASGIAVQGYGSFKACFNEVDITFLGSSDTDVYASGIVAYLSGAGDTTLEGCVNLGNFNVTVENYSKVGGIASISSGSNTVNINVLDCENAGTITMTGKNDSTARLYAGGMVADARQNGMLTVTGCSNTGNIILQKGSYTYVGGIMGVCYSSTSTSAAFSNCTVNGCRIEASNGNVGGIVGYFNKGGSIQNCTVSGGSLIATKGPDVGGIVGEAYGTNIEGCTVSGMDIASRYENDSSDDVGGIIGMCYRYKKEDGTFDDSTIKNCSCSSSTIEAYDNNAAGIAGFFEGGTVSDCNSLGNTIKCNSRAGGIVGRMESGWVVRCYCKQAATNITAKFNNAGGIVGGTVGTLTDNADNSIWIDNCFVQNNLTITSPYNVGGIMGYYAATSIPTHRLVIINCVFDGGKLKMTSGTSDDSYGIGGILGRAYLADTREAATNLGHIKIYNNCAYFNKSSSRVVAPSGTYIGGIVGNIVDDSPSAYFYLNHNVTDFMPAVNVESFNAMKIGLYAGALNVTKSSNTSCCYRFFLKPSDAEYGLCHTTTSNVETASGELDKLTMNYSQIHNVTSETSAVMKALNFETEASRTEDQTDHSNYCKWAVSLKKPYLTTTKMQQ